MPFNITDVNTKGIDQLDPDLAQLQGNILKGHSRDFMVYLFVNFKGDVTVAKSRIADFGKKFVTSAFTQHTVTRQRQEAIDRGEAFKEQPFFGFMISNNGYSQLGLTFPASNPSANFFKKGLGGKSGDWKDLHDTNPDKWDAGLRSESHAVILLANDIEANLTTMEADVKKCFGDSIDIQHRETGFVMRNKQNQVIEHFGFVDGISQPRFTTDDIDKVKATRQEGPDWDPSAPLSLALTLDPLVANTKPVFGSYAVFRKLEQNVKEFRAKEKTLAGQLKISTDLAGAMAVGRFKDGTPLATHGTSQAPTAGNEPNNFNYTIDPAGSKCPLHAHIRKTNPRGAGGFETLDDERTHRIVRRGISYGEKDIDETNPPTVNSGLLFLCLQGDLDLQFRFMQMIWANNNSFPATKPPVPKNTGIDPVIGQTNSASAPASIQHWPTGWDQAGRNDFSFRDVVTMKGGGYFFVPSMPFLTQLDGAKSSSAAAAPAPGQ